MATSLGVPQAAARMQEHVDSALDDEDLDLDDPASPEHVPRRFSRKQSRGATQGEVAALRRPSAASEARRGSVTSARESLGGAALRRLSHLVPDAAVGGGALELPVLERLRRGSRTAASIREEAGIGAPCEDTRDADEDAKSVVSVAVVTTEAHAGGARGGLEIDEEDDPRTTGTIATWRGALILTVTSTAQLLDNIFMTSVNIALPSMQRELNIKPGNLQWLVSAYTLSFGGFLLLAGVLSDRYGRRLVFSGGMAMMTIWSLACSFAQTDIQLIVFRALQGLGAAATVPSAIGVLSAYFVGRDRHRALSTFGAAGAVGFAVGLIMGGLLTGSIGWRYIFRVTPPATALLAIAGALAFPPDAHPRAGERRPALDVPGAALGTSGMILLTFALSSSDTYGWTKALVLAPLVLSIAVLGGFVWTEKKVQNPIMPMHLWRQPSFAATWLAGFLLYCWWSSVNYYLVLISQDVLLYSPISTALRFVPMGFVGFTVSMLMGRMVEHFTTKQLAVFGMGLAVISVIPAALMKPTLNFWAMVFTTSILGVIGVSISYNVLSIALVSAVPTNAKSLAGGLINTAFQLGSGTGLAICGAVQGAVIPKDGYGGRDPAALMRGFSAALWTSAALVALGMGVAAFGIRGGQRATGAGAVH